MSGFIGAENFQHDSRGAVGVLLTNVGSPDAPTKEALRRYLKQFLSDPRVIEPPPPRWKWKLILNGIILNTRPAKSAHAYGNIWTPQGSPLIIHTRAQAEKLQVRLRERFGGPIHVRFGMGYGNPSLGSALDELKALNCWKIFVLPMFPQYCSATTGSTWDGLSAYFQQQRWIPELRFNHSFHDHPAHIAALAASIRDYWAEHGEPAKLLVSFHGIPVRYFHGGDPYHCQCLKTGRLLHEALGIPDERFQLCFQSLFGRERWLQPYTEDTLKAWGAKGIHNVHVVCPGFPSDCIETLEENAITNREFYEKAGGRDFGYIPCLNDRDDHIAMLEAICADRMQGWLTEKSRYDEPAAAACPHATQKEYERVRRTSMNLPG